MYIDVHKYTQTYVSNFNAVNIYIQTRIVWMACTDTPQCRGIGRTDIAKVVWVSGRLDEHTQGDVHVGCGRLAPPIMTDVTNGIVGTVVIFVQVS